MSQPQIPTASAPAGELPPMPIDPAWVQAGTPTARGAVLIQSKDRLLSGGLWSCTAGRFKWVFSWDEFAHVLEGEATVREEGGPTHVLRAGDVAHFPRGLTTYWDVPRFVRKCFTLRTPEPLDL